MYHLVLQSCVEPVAPRPGLRHFKLRIWEERLMPRTVSLYVLLLTGFAAVSAFADVITVPGDYAQIHDAVQAAQSGDVVEVAAGTYYDCTHETEGAGTTPACVIMKSGVTLRGAGTGATIIDAQSLGRGIFVENVSDCVIEDLQVRNAYAAAYGAGILLRNVGRDVEITDVLVNFCTDGGVICYNNASPTLTRLSCIDNVAKQGGGLAIEEHSAPWVINCTISSNEAPSGAGVFIRNGSDAYLSKCTISDNVIDADYGQGGGLFIGESSPTLVRCDIIGNSSLGNGAGVAYQLGSAGAMIGCTVSGNTLDRDFIYGAGIAVDSSDPLIDGCIIVGNICQSTVTDAAGVHTLFSPAPTLRNCTIADNQTASGGSAAGLMAQWGSAPVIENCIIAFNTNGAGLYCDGGNPTISCTDIFGNAGGDVICGTDVGNNISLDPQFCGVGDYLLQTGSPCASVCGGYIGARPADCSTTGAQEAPRVAAQLLGNHPNPFNPRTTIVFRLDEPGQADVRIFDVAGRMVATLTLGDLPAGRHEAVWNGNADDGQQAASGVYFYELEALGTKQSRRMILVK